MTDDETSAPIAWPPDWTGWAEWERFADELPAEDLARAFLEGLDHPKLFTPAHVLSRRLGHIAVHGGTPAEEQAVAETVELILSGLAEPGSSVRRSEHAVFLLGAARAERAVPLLIDQGRPGAQAVVALARIGGAEAEAVLVRLAGELTSPDIPMRQRHASNAEPVLWGLCRLATPEAVDAALLLVQGTKGPWSDATLGMVVRVADHRFEPFLLELCAGPQREFGLAGLSRAATAHAVPTLLHLLHDDRLDARSHRTVARALATVGPGAAHRLTARAWENRGASTRTLRALAWALSRVLPEGGLQGRPPELLALLAHDDPGVRTAAAGALGHVADPRTEPALVRALGDPHHRVRARAANALGGLPATEAGDAALARTAGADPVACVREASRAARDRRSRSARTH
ncbi:HEAT repeat domain-containing protein [Streptacidiphilus sp. MAP12-33]|uniref:HEAT repeat domain-containing protein n=1 Tax=Streptacidiphilus sp. MAP12-33 TaxID=3156266 RepID=UPI003512AD51